MSKFICNGRRFSSLEQAQRHAQLVFEKTGVVAGIEEVEKKVKLTPAQRRMLELAAKPDGTILYYRTGLGMTFSKGGGMARKLAGFYLVTITATDAGGQIDATASGRSWLEKEARRA